MEHGNLDIGDMRLVKYEHKVGKADYRICKVVEVEKDAKDLVRIPMSLRPPLLTLPTMLEMTPPTPQRLMLERMLSPINSTLSQHTGRVTKVCVLVLTH